MNLTLTHNHRSISRMESNFPSLSRWDTGNSVRVLDTRSRVKWRRRNLAGQLALHGRKWSPPVSEIGLFASCFLIFLASMWTPG